MRGLKARGVWWRGRGQVREREGGIEVKRKGK